MGDAEKVLIVSQNYPLPEKFAAESRPGLAKKWPRWLARFNRFRTVSGLVEKQDSEQVSSLLYSMGEISDELAITLRFDEQTITYLELTAVLNAHYGVRHNVIIERAKFNRRIQRQGEAIDAFISDMYQLASSCNFAALTDELIRDRIVAGVTDEGLSNRLQAKQDLNLNEAVRMSRQAEGRKEDFAILRSQQAVGSGPPKSQVDFVAGKHKKVKLSDP